MADPSPFGTNNPFRRKPPADPADVPPPPPPPAPAADPPSTSIFDAPSPLPTGDEFRSHLRSLPQSAQPPPKTSFQKPKVVKKVRVQSPPPSSPESAGAPDIFPPARRYDDDSSSDEQDDLEDPLELRQQNSYVVPQQPPAPLAQLASAPGPPPNPFQRTLSDMEQGSIEGSRPGAASAGGKGALDVDAFRRLLLTGQAGGPVKASPNPSPPAAQMSGHLSTLGDGGSITDASSVSRQSITDAAHSQETPRTSHEISEPEVEDDRHGLINKPPAKKSGPPTTLRKKPPPPSSRHGKLIKVELKPADRAAGDGEEVARPVSSHSTSSPTSQRPSTPSDVNKPLPPAPERPDEVESIFDREAAGKVPEHDEGEPEMVDLPSPRPPTPPNASHATTSPPVPPQGSKKPVPPPRRQPHGRSESKSAPAPAVPSIAPQADENDPTPTRSSLDSNRSRSSSLRVNVHGAGPAPPPPRRPNHGRAEGSFSSPSAISFASVTSSESERSPSDFDRSPANNQFPALAETINPSTSSLSPAPSISSLAHHHSQSKLAPPPPPPARNVSVRSKRPPSVSSFDGVSRRVSREKEGVAGGPPPPPPPRQRGSSKSSIDAPSLGPRRTSMDSVKFRSGGVLAEQPDVAVVKEEDEETPPVAAPDSLPNSEALNILADLDALRREVDALRTQYGNTGGGAPSGT